MRRKQLAYFLACLAGLAISRGARAAESSVELSVETGSPDALCPDLAATRRAVRDRIGQLTLEGERRWVARYTIGHAPGGGGDYVQLSLKDGSGASRLERRLPLTGESCDTVVQAIALVLERYFRELQTPSQSSELEPEVEPEPTVPPAPPTQAPTAEAPPSPSPLPEPKTAPSLQLAAKAGFALGPGTGVLGLEAGLWFARFFAASLEPQILIPQVSEHVRDQNQADRGTAQVLELPLRATLGLGLRSERWAFRVGPAARLSFRRADSLIVGAAQSGDASAVGWAFAVGGAAGATWWLSSSVGLTASLALDANVSETRFVVRSGTSGDQSVLVSASPQGQALFGVAFGASP